MKPKLGSDIDVILSRAQISRCMKSRKEDEYKHSVPSMSDAEYSCFSYVSGGSKQYFEYGSGGSTWHMLTQSDASIISIENSMQWVDDMKGNEMFSLDRIQIQHIDTGETAEWGRPIDEAKKENWPAYSRAIFKYADEPDTILIDGRFRVACAAQVALFCIEAEISPTTILHDSARECYSEINNMFVYRWGIKPDVSNPTGISVYDRKAGVGVDYLKSVYEDYKYDMR